MSVLQETGAASRGARRARYARYVPSVGFLRFVLRRFAAMILMLLGVTVVAWALTNVVPGDPAATSLGPVGSLDPKLVEFYQHKYGLDKSLPEQYWLYLKNLLHGDLGTSFSTNRPVADDLRQFVPATAELAVLACFFGFLVGVTLGTWAALRREALPDQALRVVSLAGLSAPQFWLALIVLYFFFFKWGLAPGGGRLSPGLSAPPHTTGAYTIDSLLHGQWSTFKDAIWHMMLPALVLCLVIVGYVTRYTRSAVLEVVSEDYVRAARAKGLPERTVVMRYVPARRGAGRGHPARARVRVRPRRVGLRRVGLLLHRARPVRLPRRDVAGHPRDHGHAALRRDDLHRAQLRRRRPVRADRPADPHHVSAHELSPELVAEPLPASESLGRRLLRQMRKRPLVALGVAIIVVWLLVALFAPLVSPHDPNLQNFTAGQPPSGAHPFGTDELGRDVLSRVIYGSRISLPLASLIVVLSLVIGITLGVIAGYFRGAADGLIMRTTDLVFAFPAILLAFVVTASLGKGLQNAVLALVIVSWPAYARVTRGLVLTIGDSEYVASARLLGASSRRTIVRDVLPNFIGPVIVLAMLEVASAVLLLSGLSFLGLGAQPPTADWGGMAAEGVDYFQYWWMSTFPGIAIFTVVLAFNFVGDGLRDIFDPRVRAGSR